MSVVDGKSVLLTGGSGSLGRSMVRTLLTTTQAAKIIVFSRDEVKQWEMATEFGREPRLRFFLGDVRDRERLYRALDQVDLVIHAAALKQVPAAEYNPFEAVNTNIMGARNVIDACIDRRVQKVIALSTDKAAAPINLYGATKMVSDKLFIDGNAYAGSQRTRFAVVRYGNVAGSRGSVLSLFKKIAQAGQRLPITDERMTRFWITLPQGVRFVLDMFERMRGGEIFVPKIPSIRVTDLAKAVAPDRPVEIVGIRPGEKLHEDLITVHDARRTFDLGDFYVLEPDMEWWTTNPHGGKPMPDDFQYSSDRNTDWLDVPSLRKMLADV